MASFVPLWLSSNSPFASLLLRDPMPLSTRVAILARGGHARRQFSGHDSHQGSLKQLVTGSISAFPNQAVLEAAGSAAPTEIGAIIVNAGAVKQYQGSRIDLGIVLLLCLFRGGDD